MLMTGADFENEERHTNFDNTLNRLLEFGVLPIINENDTKTTSEIKVGDNDTLSAIIAVSANADLLILLSDIDGLYTSDPRSNADTCLIPVVREINEDITKLAGAAGTSRGTGGMITKLQERTINMTVHELLDAALTVKPIAASLSEADKNKGLRSMVASLIAHTEDILKANTEVLDAYGNGVMADRLRLDEARIKGIAKGITDVCELSDPVGRILETKTLYNGLQLEKISVPIGVVAVIYESRPNVTSDAAALLIKSGNVCILRGGKEAFRSSMAIVYALKEGLVKAGLPAYLINMPSSTERSEATELMTATGKVDLLIPRGGAGLIRACVENATVPCIETGTGICHIYVDESADTETAVNIIENAKMSRPSVCNATEVCLVNKKIANDFLPSYGRGPKGKIWKIEDMIHPLIKLCTQILSDDPLFFLINSYTNGLASAVLTYMLATELKQFNGTVDSQEIGLPVSETVLILPCGASGRWENKGVVY